MTSSRDADTQLTSDVDSDMEKARSEKTSNILEDVRDKETLDQQQPPNVQQDGSDQEKDASAQTAAVPTDDEHVYVTGWKLIVVIIVVSLSAFIMLLDTSIVVTAIPRITTQFHSLGDVGWYGSAYLIANSSLQPMTGKLYAQFSSKIIFMSFLFLFELGSLICAVATSSKMFIGGRAVSGMGAAGIMNGGLTILSACVPLEKRPLYLGTLMSVAQLGILFGPLIGGALTEYTTWRWCFYLNLPIGGLVVAAIFFIHIPDRIVKSAKKATFMSTLSTLDIPGFLLFAPTSIMFLLALEWGGTQYPWGDAKIIGLFCGAAGMLLVFLAWEYKEGDAAMIPFSMLKNRIVYSASITLFFFFGALLLFSYYLSIYFQGVKGVTPMLSGVYLLPGILSQMVGAVGSGLLIIRVGYYLPFSITSGMLATLGSGLISTFKPNTGIGTWIGFQIIAGFGRGIGMQMPIVAVQNNLPQSQNAVSLSILIFAQNFGGAVWLAFAQTAFDNSLKKALPQSAPGVSFHDVLAAGASGIRSKLPHDSITGVVLAYNKSLNDVFYLTTGAAFGALIFSTGMGWKKIAKKAAPKPAAPGPAPEVEA